MPTGEIITIITQKFSALIHLIPLIAAGILGLCFLIGFHEFGHFFFCKLFNIATPSFSIGFGPRLFSKKIGDTLFTFSAIPLGGYVEIAGAQEVGQGEQAHAHRIDEYSFAKKPYYQKMLVIAGGIFFNLIFAYTALIALFMWGLPKTPLLFPCNTTTLIKSVTDQSAAQQAGIQPGDMLIAFEGEALHNNVGLLLEKLELNAGKQVQITIMREGQTLNIPVMLGTRPTGKKSVGTLGVEFDFEEIKPHSFIDAVKKGISTTHKLIANTVRAFKGMFTKKTINGLGGPLMVISETIKGASKGVKIFLLLLAIISINLAVINLIPIPIMDGGQALFYTIEALIGSTMPETIRYGIHYITWLLVIALAIYLTFQDLLKICTAFFS